VLCHVGVETLNSVNHSCIVCGPGVQNAQVDTEPAGAVSGGNTSALSRSSCVAGRPPAAHQTHQLPAL